MANKGVLTRILATIGTVLVWFPLVAPLLLAVVGLFHGEREFMFDYLMPAELFPFALVGGALLIWAALRARSRQVLILWGMGVAVVMLVGGQGLAVVLGMASGAVEPTPWLMAPVIAALALFILAQLGVAVGGGLLLRDLFTAPEAK